MGQEEFRGQDPDVFHAWLRPFFPDGRAYRSSRGATLVVLEAFPPGTREHGSRRYLQDKLFLSRDSGVRLYQLHERGSSVSADAHYTCEDHDGMPWTVFVSGDVAVVSRPSGDGHDETQEIFRLKHERDRILREAVFVPLPEVRVPEYLFLHPDGRVFYVDATKYGYAYDRFRCFVGPRGALARVAITDVWRFKDGGSTFVFTDAGILFNPSTFGDGDKRSYWLPPGTDVTPFQAGRPVGQLFGAIEVQQIPCRADASKVLPWLLPE